MTITRRLHTYMSVYYTCALSVFLYSFRFFMITKSNCGSEVDAIYCEWPHCCFHYFQFEFQITIKNAKNALLTRTHVYSAIEIIQCKKENISRVRTFQKFNNYSMLFCLSMYELICLELFCLPPQLITSKQKKRRFIGNTTPHVIWLANVG